MPINCGSRHQQRRRRRGSGNVVDGLSNSQPPNPVSPGEEEPVVDSQPPNLGSLSRRQQRHELVRRRKLCEIERRRNLMKNTYQPSSSDSTIQSPFFYDIDEGSADSDAKEPFIYKVRGVPVPCAVCGRPHSTVCCPYFCSFPRDGHLVDDRAFVVICDCGMTIVDDRCPSGSCFPRRLRRVAFKNLDHIPPYDPSKYT